MNFFSCEEIGHIAARCPNKKNKDEKKDYKYNDKKNFKNHKSFKEKGKKTCFMAKDSKDSNSIEDEIVYIAIKDESDNNNEEDDEMALISHVSKNDTWIIDSEFSHHMTRDKAKFENFEDYDGVSVRFIITKPYTSTVIVFKVFKFCFITSHMM